MSEHVARNRTVAPDQTSRQISIQITHSSSTCQSLPRRFNETAPRRSSPRPGPSKWAPESPCSREGKKGPGSGSSVDRIIITLLFITLLLTTALSFLFRTWSCLTDYWHVTRFLGLNVLFIFDSSTGCDVNTASPLKILRTLLDLQKNALRAKELPANCSRLDLGYYLSFQ